MLQVNIVGIEKEDYNELLDLFDKLDEESGTPRELEVQDQKCRTLYEIFFIRGENERIDHFASSIKRGILQFGRFKNEEINCSFLKSPHLRTSWSGKLIFFGIDASPGSTLNIYQKRFASRLVGALLRKYYPRARIRKTRHQKNTDL